MFCVQARTSSLKSGEHQGGSVERGYFPLQRNVGTKPIGGCGALGMLFEHQYRQRQQHTEAFRHDVAAHMKQKSEQRTDRELTENTT